MGLHKQLLLGSAAVIAATAGAQAADLPSQKAAPVEYVRICDAYGAGFFYIPGTDTCLRIGGYVRAEYDYTPGHNIISPATNSNGTPTYTNWVSQVGADQDQTGMEMRGRVDLDARTQTAWGTVQTVVNLRAANTDGIRTSSATSNFLTAYVPQGNGSSSLTMERAYIRFAGITAGVASENASTAPSYFYASSIYAGFPNGIKQLAYTATFGGGFSATVALESQGDFGFVKPGAGLSPGPSATQTATGSEYVNQPDTGYELVGNVRLDQTWGFVQLAGLVGNDSVECTSSPVCSDKNNTFLGPKKYGEYGFIGSFRINLPMIAAGDQFNFQAGYGHGFLGAVGSQGGFNDLSDSSNKRVLGGVIRSDSNLVPTTVSGSSGANVDSYGLTNAWGAWGVFTHYWAPDWRSNFGLGYLVVTPPTACSTATGTACGHTAGINTQWGRGDLLETAANLIWSPTKNFDIGIEAEYLHIHSVLQNASTAYVAAGSPGLTEGGFIYHLRLERTF